MSDEQEFWKTYNMENDKPYWFTKQIREAVKDFDIKSVLEIGCGFGNHLLAFEGFERAGIDLSEYAIGLAKQRHPEIDFQLGNLLELSIQKTFDLVFTSGVIASIKPELLDQAFKEMFRASHKYILNVEAYDKTEHEINWHRGRNKLWTVHMAKRWQAFPVEILKDYDVHEEYRLTLVSKRDDRRSW